MRTIFFDHRERVFVGDWRRRGPFPRRGGGGRNGTVARAVEDDAHSHAAPTATDIINPMSASGFLKLDNFSLSNFFANTDLKVGIAGRNWPCPW